MGFLDGYRDRVRAFQRAIEDEAWERGLRALHEGDADSALKAAKRLEKQGSWRAYLLESGAWRARHREADAIAVLERGVAAFPQESLLWQELGHSCARLERFERAHEAYSQMIALMEPRDRAAVAVDDVALWLRQGDVTRALAVLDAHEAPAFGRTALYCAELRTRCLLSTNDPGGVLAIVARALEDRTPDVDWVRARLCVARARAFRMLGAPDADVRRAIEAALELNKSVEGAAELLRELDERR